MNAFLQKPVVAISFIHWLLHVECAWKATRVPVSVDGWLRDIQCSCHPRTAQRTHMYGLH